MFCIWILYFHKKITQNLFQLLAYNHWFDTQFVFYEIDVFVVFVVSQLLEKILALIVGEVGYLDSLFLYLQLQVIDDIVGNLCCLLSLKLGQNLLEVVDFLVCIEAHFLGRLLVGWFVVLDEIPHAVAAHVTY